MVSACSTRHQTGDTDSFQLLISLTVQRDSQGTFVPYEARIGWYSAGRTLSQQLRDTTQKSTPTQLTLWQTFLPGDPKTEDYSNTVELYDAVPKYFASKKRMAEQRKDGRFLNSLKQPFRHKGKDYVVKITPARIEEKDGSEKEYYPSWREELVEEALKKLACDQLNGVYLNGVAGVQFTLYELRKELKCRGHDMHLDDLLKSLMICRRAHIPAVSPLLTPVSSRNALLLQSLPMNTPFWQVNARRRKDDTGVDTAARGIVERLSRLPRRLPSDGGSSGRVRHALSTGARDRGRPAPHVPLPPGASVSF